MSHNVYPQQDTAPDKNDFCDVTRGEFEFLKKAIVQLQQRVDAIAGKLPATEKYQEDFPSDALPRGKYAGRKHSWVVDNDPWYVAWLEENNKAAGLGFDHMQIEKAQRLALERPDPGKKWR